MSGWCCSPVHVSVPCRCKRTVVDMPLFNLGEFKRFHFKQIQEETPQIHRTDHGGGCECEFAQRSILSLQVQNQLSLI